MRNRTVVILMADDDPDDTMLMREAFKAAGVRNDFRSVENGRELLDYLRHDDRFSDPTLFPRPDLILLDLNMPLMRGREALQEIKQSEELRSIPVVIFTTTRDEDTISECYFLGASAYVVKPMGFDVLTDAARSIAGFWFQLAELPVNNR